MRYYLVFIFIYIFISIHRQTVSLYHNFPVWLDTLDAWSWDRNPPNFTLDLVLYRSAQSRTTSAWEVLGIKLLLLFVYILYLARYQSDQFVRSRFSFDSYILKENVSFFNLW